MMTFWKIILTFLILTPLCMAEAPATTRSATDKLAHLQVDVQNRRIAVECESLRVEAPLEFLCVMSGTSEHESVLRSNVKPSDLHLAMLMIGLAPGSPVQYDPETNNWRRPHGPELSIHCEYIKDNETRIVAASEMMRSIKTKETMPSMRWIFAGSRVMEDGNYAADVTGYLVSIVNFDLTVIDVPELVSSSNETLEWEINPHVAPPRGATVWMVITPADARIGDASP